MQPTVGIEEELFLLDQDTNLPLTNFSQEAFKEFLSELTAGLMDRAAHGYFSEEIFPCIVELNTAYGTSVERIVENYYCLRDRLVCRSKQRGYALLAAGTHPSADWSRYSLRTDLRTPSLYTLIGRSFFICGLHVHIGLESPDQRVWLMSVFRSLTPLLLAGTASSPFWLGQETGLHSYRYFVLSAILRGGVPPVLNNYTAFERYQAQLETQRKTARELVQPQWIVRPNRKCGTLEIRIMDSNPDRELVAAIVTLIYGIACWAVKNYEAYLKYRTARFRIGSHPSLRLLGLLIAQPEYLIRENLWQAAWFGPRAQFTFVHGKKNEFAQYSFPALLSETCKACAETADRMGLGRVMQEAEKALAERNSAAGQANAYRAGCSGESGSNVDAVLSDLVALTMGP